MYRIAKIKVDINQLENYKVALKEQMNTAIKVEHGVLSYTDRIMKEIDEVGVE